MKRIIIAFTALALAACSGKPAFDPATVADATAEQVTRVEPLSWWTGMKMPLQLLVQGEGISGYDVTIEGGAGVSVEKINKADSPNYLFVDVKIAADAQPGTYYIVFSKDGQSFKYPYEIAARKDGSAERTSFTTADMIYLIMPD
ncbi:MAG: cyclomaltodextrinase N-terminal domain-containing protein, partial [Bacteroidales bacterium]|nr:cyclomaltodextrinase N-terminal domain-containing protein [Bacteroidales bacterium]